MLVVENGTVSWPDSPLATVAEADAYAAARVWADWAALTDEKKLAAILDATTFITASYRPPAKDSDAIEKTIRSAAIEAARLAAKAPLIGGEAAGQRGKKSVKAGSVAVEFDDANPAAQQSARLALVSTLLQSAGVYRLGGGVNVRIAKA